MWILLVLVCVSKINAEAYLKQQGDILTCTVKNSESAIFLTNQDDEYLPAESISENAYEVNELNINPISSYHAGRLIPILPVVVDQRWENFKAFNISLIPIGDTQFILSVDNLTRSRNDLFARFVGKNVEYIRDVSFNGELCYLQKYHLWTKFIKFYTIYDNSIRDEVKCVALPFWLKVLKINISSRKDFHYHYYLYNQELSFNVTLSITSRVNCIKLYYYMCTSCNMSLNLDGESTHIYYSNNVPNGTWHTLNICKENFITNSSVLTVSLKTNNTRFQFKFWALSSIILFNSATYKRQFIQILKNYSKISCNVLETGTKLTWDPVNYINETCEDICSICSGENCFQIYSQKKSLNYLIAALISSLIISIFLICTLAYMMFKKTKGKAKDNSSNVQELDSINNSYEPIPFIQENYRIEMQSESNAPIYETVLEAPLPTNSKQVESDVYYTYKKDNK